MPSVTTHRRAMHPALRAAGLLPLAFAFAGCQSGPTNVGPAVPSSIEMVEDRPLWLSAVADGDQARIDALDEIWDEAMSRARRAGFARQMAREGALLDPEAALPRPAPTPGNYMCRLVRFGSGEARTRAFTAYRDHFCHIGSDGSLLSLTKQTGSDRPGGYLFEDDHPTRMIFLGSLALGDEEPAAYGEDPERDMAGQLERIGSFRFRLVVPAPRFGVLLEIMELTPAPVQNE